MSKGEEEKDMSVAESRIGSNLEKLKARAMKRKKSSSNKKVPKSHLRELNENANLLSDEQYRTME